MTVTCIVCKKFSIPGNNIRSFHKFPSDSVLRQTWISALSLSKVPKTATVCSDHFDEKLFHQTNGYTRVRRLLSNAVPSQSKKAIPCPEKKSLGTTQDDENITRKCGEINYYNSPVHSLYLITRKQQFLKASGSSTTPRQKVTKSNRGVPLPEAKEIIASVYHYLQTEYENLKSYTGGSCDLSPLANILKRTAEATGVSEQTVTAVIEEEHSEDPVRSKRAKVSLAFEDEDVSPIEEESSCGSADDAQHDDGERQMEQEEHEVETLKVEVEDYDDDHNDAMKQRLFLEIQPLSTQNVSAVHQSLPVTHAEVKQEPVDAEDQEPMEGGDTVESTASVEDPLCESTSAVHHLLCSTDLEAKSKSKDDVYQDVESSSEFTTHVRRRPD